MELKDGIKEGRNWGKGEEEEQKKMRGKKERREREEKEREEEKNKKGPMLYSLVLSRRSQSRDLLWSFDLIIK